MNNITRIIVGIFLGLVIASALFNQCSKPKPVVSTGDKTVEVRLVTKIDTQYIKQFVHVHDTIKVPTLVKADTVFLDGTKQVVMMPTIHRTYSDTVHPEDSIEVKYTAKVTGTLDNINLEYKNTKSIMVIHKADSVFTNTTITKHPGGLYMGVNAGYNEFSPQLQYIKDKNAFGVKYNIINSGVQGVGISYSRKLF